MERIKGYLEGGFVPAINPLSVYHLPDFTSDAVVIEGYFVDNDSKELFIAPCLIPRECNSIISVSSRTTISSKSQ